MSDSILHHLKDIETRIAHACQAAGRNPAGVRLLLATKTVPGQDTHRFGCRLYFDRGK